MLERSQFFLSFQEETGLDIEQIDVLKNGFDGLDKENTGMISATGMQMIYKMIGLSVQVCLK